MKKIVCLMLVLGVLFAQGALAQERVFTDSLGRSVSLPQEIDRIAITGPLAQIAVFAIAPDKLVGISSEWDDYALPFIAPEYTQLPVLGQLYGGKSNANPESLLAAAPQVVIDVGEAKGSAAEDLDELSMQTGIPFVHISATLETMDAAYLTLGDLLGRQEEGRILAEYCRSTYDRMTELASGVDKANMLYVTGDKGLNVIANGSYHSEVIDLMCNNLAVVDAPSSRGTGNEVDMEQMLIWNPDVIIFTENSIYETVGSDPLWKSVSAVQNGTYYEVPVGPYNWMGFPPGAQRLLGMMWMGKLLYPQAADYDLYEEVARYFDLFYHSDITREQFDALTARSIGRQ